MVKCGREESCDTMPSLCDQNSEVPLKIRFRPLQDIHGDRTCLTAHNRDHNNNDNDEDNDNDN